MFVGAFIIVGAAVLTAMLFLGGIHYLVEGRFPRPLFLVLASWWWPFRSPSAATLAADVIDADDDADVWGHSTSLSGTVLTNADLQTRVQRGAFDNSISFSLANEDVPLTAWEDFSLWRSVKNWLARRDVAIRTGARDRAAKTVRDILRKRKTA